MFAAQSWWNLFVTWSVIVVIGAFLVMIAESVGKGFSAGLVARAALEEFSYKRDQEARQKEARERFERGER
jgi:hypothetical protein